MAGRLDGYLGSFVMGQAPGKQKEEEDVHTMRGCLLASYCSHIPLDIFRQGADFSRTASVSSLDSFASASGASGLPHKYPGIPR